MDQQTLLSLLTVFVGIAAVSLLLQLVALVALAVIALQVRKKMLEFAGPVQDILGISKRTLGTVEGQVDKLSGHIDKIGSSAVAIMDTSKEQLNKVTALLDDASARAKVQMERAELVLDDTMTRVQTTASFIQSGVLRPVREVHGIFTGIRTAIMHLGRPGRTVDHATSDEEMFI